MSTTTSIYGFVKHARGDTPWDVEANADFDGIDSEIARPRLPFNSPTVGATTTCDLSLARVFVMTISQATTLSFTNVPAATFACRIRLLLTNAAAFLITWPAAVVWLAGIKPTFKASGVDEVELLTKDAGTTWYAGLRNLRPGPIFQDANKTTTSGVDVSVSSYSLAAGTLAVNGQAVRITMGGLAPAGGASVTLKFGATGVASIALGANEHFFLTELVTRTGAATQASQGIATKSITPTTTPNRGGPAETLSGAVLIDFRGNATTGGQTLTFDTMQVELLAVA